MSKAPLVELEDSTKPSLKIAVEGCGHGSLDEIYKAVEASCDSRGWTMADIDFLLICVRNSLDLNCMSVPRKYRKLGDFHAYYSGEKRAPILTIVIGGNHEASNYFFELYHGGWLAPNIYYMGAANVLRYGPFRIAGLSGIFNRSDYHRPHHERLPYDRNDIRSIYHVRDYDVMKLLKIRQPVDIGVSHDWPRRVEWFGDYKKLFGERRHFFESAKENNLGSEPAEQLLNHLRPTYWFSGHMHVKYSATVKHASAAPVSKSNPSTSLSPGITNDTTQFLALDKPGPGRSFLELVEIKLCSDERNESTEQYLEKAPDNKFALSYDEEWLAITRYTADALTIQGSAARSKGQIWNAHTIEKNLHWVNENITAKGLLKIPDNFERHAPIYDPSDQGKYDEQPPEFPNSQTAYFCQLLGIPNKFSMGDDEGEGEEDDGIVFG
ncbi:hypothetical protein AJ79_05296 [Helicocarpus griseus UAMH5409]|uniref:Lariat debranching enzyme C-terminal domain-containing protein n=1 Tax=Helicocarpus griseus UAMH5409 TaxID=1447875 RepID=A0A2B7XP39_9EURO|nr:hypothetical protein AJ79_05296 [Helicocarpus griseus UAMH5409]